MPAARRGPRPPNIAGPTTRRVMKIAVCVKQIPDPATPYPLDPATHFLVRPNEQVLDDTDRYGIEVGLQLAEATSGSVTLVSMGPAGKLPGNRPAPALVVRKGHG